MACVQETTFDQTTECVPVGHEHILLVDDEPQLLAMQEQILERLGYAVTAMRHSKDALAMFRLALNDALDQSETHPVAQGVVLQ